MQKQNEWTGEVLINRGHKALRVANQIGSRAIAAAHKYRGPGVPCSIGSKVSPCSLHEANKDLSLIHI